MAVARGNEKGRVERAIRYVRDGFFAARSFEDLDDLNAQAEIWCNGPGDGDFLRSVAEAVLQLLMETDVEGLIGAGRYERGGERTTWRNGHRDRVFDTRLGSDLAEAALAHAPRDKTEAAYRGEKPSKKRRKMMGE